MFYTYSNLNIISCGCITAVYDVSPTMTGNREVGTFLYEKTFTRMGAYFVGGTFGFSYFELSKSNKYPELKNTFANK